MNPRTITLTILLPLLVGQKGVAAPSESERGDVRPTGIMRRLSETMAGRPVMAVGFGRSSGNWSDERATALARAESDLGRLQVLSAAFSRDGQTLIPFKVGDAYVIAPEQREALNPNLRSLNAEDVAGRGVLLSEFLAGLTDEQGKGLAADDGLAVASLPPDLQRLVVRAFRPPLDMEESIRRVQARDDGTPQVVYDHKSDGSLDQPLDWTKARIRARLRLGGAQVTAPGGGSGYLLNGFPSGLTLTDGQVRASAEVDLPIFLKVPNTFKLSDLTGKALSEPIGIHGVRSVREVLDRLATVTGLKLSAWEPYRERPVFLGADSLRCGDVLDGLRLALTAAWRKMGDSYYLAWDRVPMGAIQQSALEATAGAAEDLRRFNEDASTAPPYYRLVETLPFAGDDALAPTAAQRRLLFGPAEAGKDAGASDRAVPFDAMTSGQQAHLREMAPTSTIRQSTPGEPRPSLRPMTEDDLRGAYLMPSGMVEVSVSVPGKGWLPLSLTGLGLHFSRWGLDNARRRANPDAATVADPAMPPEMRAMLKDPKPVTPPSDLRGLVVPALTPARLAALADEMKRHGLNVLFYPALFNGYATLPNAAFPQEPALKGQDGLAAAVAATKPKGIRVVAYLNTLAWQNADTPVHWLNRHPDWLDVDVLGRGRLAFLKEFPNKTGVAALTTPPDPHNYVRASGPEVESRLKALVRAVSAQRGVSAVAFAAWRPRPAIPSMQLGLQPPDLGYAWADRLAAFRETGADPADRARNDIALPDAVRGYANLGPRGDDPAQAQRTALVGRLMDAARAARKDWRVYLVDDTASLFDAAQGAGNLPALRPDLTIATFFDGPPATQKGYLFPVLAKTMGELVGNDSPAAAGLDAAALNALSPIVAFGALFSDGGPLNGRRAPMALYDFRDTPRIITDSLKWIAPPAR